MMRSKWTQAFAFAAALSAQAGMQWTPRNPVTGIGDFSQVVWDGKRCLASSESGDLVVSATCDSWSRVASPAASIYAMVGSEDPQHPLAILSDNQYLYRSEDGATWTRDSLLVAPTGDRVRASLGVYKTAQGFASFMGTDTAMYLASTVDSKAWSFTRIEMPNPHSLSAYSPSVTLLYNSATMLRSADGIHWASSPSDSFQLGYKSVHWFQGRFVATTLHGTLLTSPDGLDWTRRDDLRAKVVDEVSATDPTDTSWASWKQGAVFDGELVLVSTRSVFRTKDLSTWTKDSTMQSLCTKVPYFDRSLFSVGAKLAMTNQGAAIYVTGDLKNWTNTIGTVTTKDLYSVTGGGPRWVAVGAGGTVVFSKDGIRWDLANTATAADLFKVVWTGKMYKVVGDSGKVLSSGDGENWTSSSMGAAARLADLFWSDSIQLIVADSNRVYQSTDGSNWKVQKPGAGDGLDKIRYSGSRWLLSGGSKAIYISTDGSVWTAANAPADVTVPVWTGSAFLFTPGFSVYSSLDGQAWKSYKSNTWSSDGDVADLQMVSGKVVLLRPTGSVAVLAHDTEWISIGSGSSSGVRQMGASDSLWVQVGSRGAIQTSPAPTLPSGIQRREVGAGPELIRIGSQVRFALPRSGNVRLEAWSIRGQKMTTLVDGPLPAGSRSVSISGLPHGPVLLRLSGPSGSAVLLTVP